MRDSLQFTEPHPTLPKSRYLPTGRGGAGNYAKYDASKLTPGPTASGPASTSTSSTSTTSTKSSKITGRGGFGNRIPASNHPTEMAIFSFDEELERQQKMLDGQAPFYTVGRGGAGNIFDERKSSAGSDRGSVSSGDSGSGGDSRVRRSLERLSRWGSARS